MGETEKKTGRVLRIEHSSLHDGPGLRTVVFMKGCPLRCRWCSTPESQNRGFEFAFRQNRCAGCGTCAAVCPEGAISMENAVPIRNPELCTFCLKCSEACPKEAWEFFGRDMTAEQVLHEITRDEIFYFHSGGGVTFSGGEPLAQAPFVAEVMRQCRREGIHTAMETSLYAPWEQLEPVLQNLDYLLADIKGMDPQLHRWAAGKENGLILDNFRRIEESSWNGELHVRIPLIPGINDSEENLKETVRFCDALTKAKEIELLPYHRLGLETYRNMGIPYSLEKTEVPTAERMKELEEMMKRAACRIPIRVGG